MNDPVFLRELAARYGTPAYLYDLAAVRAAARALKADLPPGARLMYSVKANPHPLVIAALCAEGLGAEVSSTGEVVAASGAGCPPEHMIHTGPGKSMREIVQSLKTGVRTFSVESPTDRARLAEAAAAADTDCAYVVRLNGPAGSGSGSLRMTGRPTAFGVDTTDSDALTELFRPLGPARPVGVHTFFATNVATQDALLSEFDQALRTVAGVCERTGFTPQVLDLGGGFPAPFARPGELTRHPRLTDSLTRMLDEHAAVWRQEDLELMFESGRYLAATAGTLLTQVLDVKRTGDRTFTVLDAGVNALGGMSGLGRLVRPSVQPYRIGTGQATGHADRTSRDEECIGETGSTALVGPLCTPLDVLNGAAALRTPRAGDLFAVPNVGAYGLTAGLIGFLSHPAPVEIVLDEGEVLSARRLTLRPIEVAPRN
ncbi:type III PLP-dependent enzyme [Streptomyces sp. NPDC056323]|uniref:type III PLP-dependent enzyme n=1 Tax=Streptomyces sp. NPDC056323 TaxID=3345784 RepID=UPI0035DBBA04